MKNQEKGFVTPIIITLIILLTVGIFYLNNKNSREHTDLLLTPDDTINEAIDDSIIDDEIVTPEDETIDLIVFIQDIDYIDTSCSVTKSINIEVPKTTQVADTSLRFLFETELERYGFTYKSVTINDGVAKIMLESDIMSNDQPATSLSSCESSHILSVLNDTLVQYDSVNSVELHSPQGGIQF